MESIKYNVDYLGVIMSAAKNYKHRMIQVIVSMLFLVAGIVLYVLFFTITDIGIPCIFHEITGMLCPGCGMTHAMSSIIQRDFLEAFSYNALSLTICPLIIMYFMLRALKYIKTGHEEFSFIEILFLIICLVICVWYFLFRNNLI